MDRMSC